MTVRWPRDDWLDALWDCEDPALKPAERTMAYTYARYAGKTDLTWCPDEEMRRRTGISSRDTLNKTRKTLISRGWLVEVERPRQHRSGRYRMTIPESEGEMRRHEQLSDG